MNSNMAKHLHTIIITENEDGAIGVDILEGAGNLVTLYGMLEYARYRLDLILGESYRKAEGANDKTGKD